MSYFNREFDSPDSESPQLPCQCNAMPYHAMLCHAMSRHVMPCYVMPCYFIASIWRENMLGYLSADIICSRSEPFSDSEARGKL